MTIYRFDENGVFTGAAEAEAGSVPGSFLIPRNSTPEAPPEIPDDMLVRWNGMAWKLEPKPPSQDNPPTEIPEGTRPAWNGTDWEFLTLDDLKERKIREIDANTSRLILAGFDHEVAGVTYHFGYDADDQGNFTKATLAATLSIIRQLPFAQPWRGWTAGSPHTLTLDAAGMVALATFAGVNHQQGLLSSGWDLTQAVREAEDFAELDAVQDGRE